MIGRLNDIRLLLLAALPALLLASCSREEMDGGQGSWPDTQDGAIRFEIGFAPQAEAVQTAPHTRVATDTLFSSTWEEGDQIGVYAVEHGEQLAASGNYIHNVKLTYSSGSWMAAETMAWPADGTKLDFYAYYPYDAEATDPTAITFNVASDQNASTGGKPNYNRSNLLMAKADNAGRGYALGNTVTLGFKHALAMVQIKTGANMGHIKVVRLNGCFTETTLDLSTQATTAASSARPQRVTMYACPNDGGAWGTFAYRALVPVQTIDAGTAMFRFESGSSYFYQSPKLTNAVPLEAGMAETFDFSLPYVSITVAPGNSFGSQTRNLDLSAITHLKVYGQIRKGDFKIFKSMSALTHLDLGGATVLENVIPSRALEGKSSLKEFVFPQNITSIGNYAFKGCSGLYGSLVIPAGVTSIGQFAFGGCIGFEGSLTIPESVTSIKRSAFDGCKNFSGSLTIPPNLTLIENSIFYGCKGFSGSLTIPASVTLIDIRAFYGCEGLDGSLTIPAGVKRIDSSAFGNCISLTSIISHITDPNDVIYGGGVFSRVPTSIPVRVPQGTEELYKNHAVWKPFQIISQKPFTP